MGGLVIDIVDLPQHSGAIKDVHLDIQAPSGLGTQVIGVPSGSAVVLDAQLTSLEDGVLARGSAALHLHGECVRCLRDIDEDRTVAFDELYVLPESARAQVAEGDEEADDLFVLGETTLDLEPALRDALVLTLPFQPLCRPDCGGLCPVCGERLDDLPADHAHETLDPRWSALEGLLQGDDAGAGPGADGATAGAEQRPAADEGGADEGGGVEPGAGAAGAQGPRGEAR